MKKLGKLGPDRSTLREYNHLFKRKETVQLKHKWETDDEDGEADVASSSESGEAEAHDGAARSADHEQ